jgi:hypothetical protein
MAWLLGRYVLNGNPLAWPLMVFLALALQTAAVLLGNQRFDLLANGIALLAFSLITILWTVRHA